MRPLSTQAQIKYNQHPLAGKLQFPVSLKQRANAKVLGTVVAATARVRKSVLASNIAGAVLQRMQTVANRLDDLAQIDVHTYLRRNPTADPFSKELQRTENLTTKDNQSFQIKIYRPAGNVSNKKLVVLVGGLAMETGPWARVGKNSSLMQRVLDSGATVIEVDHPGGGLSPKVKYAAKGYAETMVEEILPAVNAFIKEDTALCGLSRTYIGHSLGGTVLKMMVEQQGKEVQQDVENATVNVITMGSSDRFYPDLDPAFIAILGLDPLLQSLLGDRRNVPYAGLGPLMRVAPEQILKIAAGMPVMGNSLDASVMREFFGTTPLPISMGMVRDVLVEGLLGETAPKVRQGPVIEGFQVVSLYAENDPWGPPEGFAELHQGLSSELRARAAFYSVGSKELTSKLPQIIQTIGEQSVLSLGIMSKADLGLGHAAIALPTPQQLMFAGPIIDAVLAN